MLDLLESLSDKDAVDDNGARKEDIDVGDVLRDFKRAYEAKRRFMDTACEDFEFALGKQWDDEDVEVLRKAGVRALTINKISPHISLLKGIESQNRSEYYAFPEGQEDTLNAEIATRLIKSVVKTSELEYKLTELFEDGNICGESCLEPWIKYPYRTRIDGTVDLTGELCWRKNYYDTIFPDPNAKEYDLSDAAFLCKFTADLSKDQLIELFPEKKNLIEEIEKNGKISIDSIHLDRDQDGFEVQRKDYKPEDDSTDPWLPKNGFDLIDYYYKKYVMKYYVADFKLKQVRMAKDKKQAQKYLKQATKRDDKSAKPSAKIIERLQPEIWVAFVTGGTEEFLAHGPAWSFPAWKSYPYFEYFAYKSSAPIASKDRDFLIQGVTRRLKDHNRELNKRRTQELRHLNQSTNSGWQAEEDSLIDEDKYENFGSSPGVVLKYRKGAEKPTKITPTPLSQGHAQLAQEHQQDMREAIGISLETLALESDQSSGRAIALRQKQGLVMVQGIFDNLARTRKTIGRFILAILSELFDVEKAMRTLGESFLKENFSRPAVDPASGLPIINPMTGQPEMEFDKKLAMDNINRVLNDIELGIYDVNVGEVVSSETIQYGNYLQLTDMAGRGLPIPPDLLVQESTLSASTKKRLIANFQQAAARESMGAPPKK